jgi:hypothetical protein
MDNVIYRDRSSWYYLDLEDYEYSIRQEMVSDEVDRRRRARSRKIAERKAKHNRKIYFAIQRLIGLMFIIGTMFTIIMLKDTDVSFALVTIPVGLLMVFSRKKYLLIGRRNKRNRD